MNPSPTVWKKTTRSASESNCVELASFGAVRDSKNPTGPKVRANLATMLAAIKAGRLDH